MRYLIVGCGRVGSALAKLLDATATKSSSSTKTPPRSSVWAGVQGPPGGWNRHRQRRPQRAGPPTPTFVAVTDGDNRNIMAALIARRMFNIERVVARIYDPARGHMYRELGVQTVVPTTMGAKLIRDVLLESPWDPVCRSISAAFTSIDASSRVRVRKRVAISSATGVFASPQFAAAMPSSWRRIRSCSRPATRSMRSSPRSDLRIRQSVRSRGFRYEGDA